MGAGRRARSHKRAAALGLTTTPAADQLGAARAKGWIALPTGNPADLVRDPGAHASLTLTTLDGRAHREFLSPDAPMRFGRAPS
jgi:crotonobetainyl-CoA:carnitine CoA-transferase CaiB-like acyl-CoA transferase